jgi:murein DD-endopeptidase MepM/ murein hydrolase activator NlpD
MAEKKFYYFNPKTLAFEKEKVSLKDIIKRLSWFLATSIAFALLVLWIAFYVFDSPKEKMLRRENEDVKQQLLVLNKQLDVMNVVLSDIRERDDQVYRAIFEARPLDIEQRYDRLLQTTKHDILRTAGDVSRLLAEVDTKSKRTMLLMAGELRSMDTLSRLAVQKEDMRNAIPAIRPLKNMTRVTSGFGMRYHPILKFLRPHTGIDITAPQGTPVYATADGVVSSENSGGGYGIAVLINHGYSYQTRYAHLSKKIVTPGQRVKRGQMIGYTGNTGLSFGPHLHYEVIKNGVFVNPVHYFFSNITLEEYESILQSSKEINQALS